MPTSNPEKGIHRRQFMKQSSLAVGGLMVAPALQAGIHAAGADEIKIGLIGCGGRGTGAAMQALSTAQNVKLVAMADAFSDRLESSLKNLSNPDYRDWSGDEARDFAARIDVPEDRRFVGFDAYKQVIPLVDVVLLATPPGFRPIHFEAAIAADKHVFMEKPVATDLPGIRKVMAAAELARQKKLNVVVGLQRHYQKVYTEWVERLHGGAIGDIHTARVYWNGGGVWVRERKKGQTEMEYQMRNWYYFNWLCGDHITEQHIHNLDVGNWVMRGHPVRAHGMGGREVRKGMDHGQIFDHHVVEFEYANGARMFSQCRHIKGCMDRVSEAFQGSSGYAPSPGVIHTANHYQIWKHRGKKDPNPYQVEHDLLFEAIAKGEHTYNDGHNGAVATMTALLGRAATYSGKVVEWDELMQSKESLMPDTFAFDANPPVMPDKDGRYPVPVPGQTMPF